MNARSPTPGWPPSLWCAERAPSCPSTLSRPSTRFYSVSQLAAPPIGGARDLHQLRPAARADARGFFQIARRFRAIAERVVDHARVVEEVRIARAQLHRLADGRFRLVESLVAVERPG